MPVAPITSMVIDCSLMLWSPHRSHAVHSTHEGTQPGRVALLERAVEKLSQWRWWLVGAAAGSTGVISVLAWVVTEVKK